MSVFPFMQKIDEKSFLVIGSGAIARRKVRLLLQFTDQIVLVTHPRQDLPFSQNQIIHDELEAFSDRGVIILDRMFDPDDLTNADFCIASCDDQLKNSEIASLCQSLNVPVNVPDNPDICTFFLPSVIKRGNLVITVSTQGKSPAMSAGIRRRIEDILPDKTEEILDCLAGIRLWAPRIVSSSETRARLYKDLLNSLLDGSLEPCEEQVQAAAKAWLELKYTENGLQ